MKIEILVTQLDTRIESTIETDNESLVIEASESKHCVDRFRDENGKLELVQLYFVNVSEFKDWFNTAF